MATLTQLRAAQEREFPGSVILTRRQVRDRWLIGSMGHYTNAAPSLALATLQHRTLLFYEYRGQRGARYGVAPSHYISGFGTF
jgi:hypothetical protein